MLGMGYDDMGYWQPQERRTKDLSARVTKTVYDGVKDVARLWTTVERIRSRFGEVRTKLYQRLPAELNSGLEAC